VVLSFTMDVGLWRPSLLRSFAPRTLFFCSTHFCRCQALARTNAPDLAS
jgi:hypothetical protein